MPTYEYRCPDGHEFEVFQRMNDQPGADCPVCGQPATRQLSAGAGLLFKGSGFYITDYRDSDYKKKAEKEGGGAAKTDAPKADASKADSPGNPKADSSGKSDG